MAAQLVLLPSPSPERSGEIIEYASGVEEDLTAFTQEDVAC